MESLINFILLTFLLILTVFAAERRCFSRLVHPTAAGFDYAAGSAVYRDF